MRIADACRLAGPLVAALVLLNSAGASTLPAQGGSVSVTTVREDTLAQHARRIIEGARYAAFITTDASGAPQVRTVQPQLPDSLWTVWFATNPRTRKVEQVTRDARVVLHYWDARTLSYVALTGTARVVRDRATKDAHWAPAWNAFYPDRDSSVVLIAVTAERLEIASATLPISSDPVTWRPPSVRLRRSPAPAPALRR